MCFNYCWKSKKYTTILPCVFRMFSFELSGTASYTADGTCTGDFVRITDGSCNNGRAETRYCGNSNIAPFLSTGNKLCLKFYSDESLTSKGFNASFEAIDRPARPKGMEEIF